MAPFVWGGAEQLAVYLRRGLIEAGHDAEVLRIPFQWEPVSRIPSQMLLARTLELRNVDRVIALKFPAYLIRHPHKTLWLVHQYRQAYDLNVEGIDSSVRRDVGHDIRNLIVNADNECFRESKAIFTISEVTQQRLLRYNGFKAQVVRQPLNDPEIFTGGELGDYVFAGGRINKGKRQDLLLRAMVKAKKNVRLVIAGPPDSPSDAEELLTLVSDLNLSDRVQLDLRMLPRNTYADYVNGAAAIACLPFDEDSLSYVAMEAAAAGKAIISTTDSGGVLGLARGGQTGWVMEPSVEALACALDEACGDRERARALGNGARDLWLSMGLNWPNTIKALLQ